MTTNVERMLPLYEAKMIHHFDHRWATFGCDQSVRDVTELEKTNPSFVPTPRYWVRAEVVSEALKSDETLLLGVRDITNSTNERTVISNPVPVAAVGNNLPIMVGASHKLRLSALLSSFALDFVARPKVGGVHLNFFIANQLAVLPPTIFDETLAWGDGSIGPWVDDRTQELVETSYDMASQPNYVRAGSSWRTFQGSLFGSQDLGDFSGPWPTSGMGGPTGFWIRNTSEWPSDGSASMCSLASILELDESVPPECFLSPRACRGLLERASRRGRALPAALRGALEAVARRP